MSAPALPIRLWNIQPVLAVSSIPESTLYWRDPLGFSLSWVWGEPPQFCQVVRDEVGIWLALNPLLAASAEGREVLISVRNIEGLYAQHSQQGAQIVAPLQRMPWGSQEYAVREPNGYRLRFSAPVARTSVSKTLPPSVRIVERAPTILEYTRLAESVGWKGSTEAAVTQTIAASRYALVAEDLTSGSAVGSLFLLPVGASDFYLKDVMVHPDWQGQRIGTTLLHELMRWLNVHAPEGSLVSLHTDEATAPFYKPFGFTPHFGMSQRIRRTDG